MKSFIIKYFSKNNTDTFIKFVRALLLLSFLFLNNFNLNSSDFFRNEFNKNVYLSEISPNYFSLSLFEKNLRVKKISSDNFGPDKIIHLVCSTNLLRITLNYHQSIDQLLIKFYINSSNFSFRAPPYC